MRLLTSALPNVMHNLLFQKLIVLMQDSYDVFVIDDESVPLGAGPAHANYYVITLCTLAAILILAAVTVWFTKRRKLANRLLELRTRNGNDSKSIPLSLRTIKDEISSEESILAATFV